MVVHSLGRDVGTVTAIRISDQCEKHHAKREASFPDNWYVGAYSHLSTTAVSVRVGVVPLLPAANPKTLALD